MTLEPLTPTPRKRRKAKPARDLTQAGEGYGCSCGFIAPNRSDFGRHFLVAGKKDGPGTHKSIGRVSLDSGEVVMRPWNERTDAEKSQSSYAVSEDRELKDETGSGDGGGDGAGDGARSVAPRVAQTAKSMQEASQIRLIPRVYTFNLTPIVQMAYSAACNEWQWPQMTLEDFLDTCLTIMFSDRGIVLSGYIVKQEEEGNHGSESS